MNRLVDRASGAIIGALALALIAVLAGIVDAGPLDPSDPPSPTMKTLEEIEPRTAISSLTFAITDPGSYYLTSNLTGTGFNPGITIDADDVVIDLNGFTLTGGSTAGGIGITALSPHKNVTVRNGTVRAWNHGVNLQVVSGAVVEDVQAIGMGGFGIQVGVNGTVRDCVARDNANESVKAGDFSTVSGCSVFDTPYSTTGILAGRSNLVENSVVEGIAGDGIFADAGSVVRGNVVSGNGNNGIAVASNTLVTGNVAAGNGAISSSGNGIYASGNGNTIQANTVTGNDRGIYTGQTLSVVIGNTAMNNGAAGITDEFVIQTSQVAGPTLDGTSVDTATNPYANFAP